MLEHLNYQEQASAISLALKKVLSDGKVHTSDVGGSAGTGDFVQALIKELRHC
jgi:isocitrate/isopropylmalate dehydrogenase